MNEEIMNNEIEMEETTDTEALQGEVYDTEEEAMASTEDKHTGIGVAAGLLCVAVGAAATAGVRKLIKQKEAKKESEGGENKPKKEKKAEDPNVLKLTFKERLTGKVKLPEEEKKTEG